MGISYYQTMVLIPPSHPFSMEQFVELLGQRFQSQTFGEVVGQHPNNPLQAWITRDDWRLYIALETEPHVLIESAEVAAALVKDQTITTLISQCSQRITIFGDPDPTMTYFNTYILTLEVLDTIEGLYIFENAATSIRLSGSEKPL